MSGSPPVTRCDVTNCFYNRQQGCHAAAINVGSNHPACDTYVSESRHIGRTEGSMVGACHVSDCRFNTDLMCTASGIAVIGHAGHADCATFQKR